MTTAIVQTSDSRILVNCDLLNSRIAGTLAGTLRVASTYLEEDEVEKEVDLTQSEAIAAKITVSSVDYYPFSFSPLKDGVYYLEFKNVNGSVTTYNTICVLVDTDLKPTVVQYTSDQIKAGKLNEAYKYYQVLTLLNTCSDQTCSDAVIIYNALTDILNGTQTNDCGCN